MFWRKKKEINRFPPIEIFRDVMGIQLTERRYNNLKSVNDNWDIGNTIMATIIILSNLGLLQTKPFEDDSCNNSGQDPKNK